MKATTLIGAIVRAEVPGYEPFEARSYRFHSSSRARDEDVEDLARLTVCEDSMGVYFPGVEWEDDLEDDDGEDDDEEEEITLSNRA